MSQFLKDQAARCMQLSGTCFDLETSARLRRMAEEFRAKAREMETTTPAAAEKPATDTSRWRQSLG